MKFYQLLGGGLKDAGWQREHMSQNRLAILPNLTHYEMGRGAAAGRHRAAVPQRRRPRKELGRAGEWEVIFT